jgi:hypothetical protein
MQIKLSLLVPVFQVIPVIGTVNSYQKFHEAAYPAVMAEQLPPLAGDSKVAL